jgi:CDP-glycerol glycerophosphotransferase (TagB/SpsB family)
MRDGHGGKNWRQIICEIEKRRSNLKLATGQDATPYMLASDVLVSDASGVAYEFILLDRPVVFFDVPELFARYGKNGIHFWGREGGDIVRDVEELREAVMLNMRNPARKKPQREKLLPRICYSRGDATEKAGRAILALMETPRNSHMST